MINSKIVTISLNPAIYAIKVDDIYNESLDLGNYGFDDSCFVYLRSSKPKKYVFLGDKFAYNNANQRSIIFPTNDDYYKLYARDLARLNDGYELTTIHKLCVELNSQFQSIDNNEIDSIKELLVSEDSECRALGRSLLINKNIPDILLKYVLNSSIYTHDAVHELAVYLCPPAHVFPRK